MKPPRKSVVGRLGAVGVGYHTWKNGESLMSFVFCWPKRRERRWMMESREMGVAGTRKLSSFWCRVFGSDCIHRGGLSIGLVPWEDGY